MSLPFDRPLKIAVAWIAILLAGAFNGWLGQRARRVQMQAELVDHAKRSAVAFEPVEMRSLSGSREDLATPSYSTVKNRLRRLNIVDPQVRFLHIVRFVPEAGKIVVLADSAAAGATGELLPGDDYARTAESPGLQETIGTGRPATAGPFSDATGRWVTGYAIVGAAPSTKAGIPTKEILAVDIDVSNWQRELWRVGLQRAFYVWVLLGLPLAAWLAMRRQVRQGAVIRNLSEAMEQSHSALMIAGVDGRVEYANRGLCEQIGYTRDELVGKNWRELHVAETPAGTLADLVADVPAGESWDREWVNRRKDGAVYPVRGVVTPVKHRDGSLACFVAVFDDVTELKHRETELREARDLAEAGDRAKSQFLATMSHEVRTPLNGIIGFTSLLLETDLAAEQREYVQTIRASGEALIQLTSDILDFARIESGKLKLDALACDPRECIEDALDLLAAKAAEKNIELLHRVANDVPAAVVTDGGRLRQVLVNLVGNAVKFTESGEVEIEVRIDPAATRTENPAHAGEPPGGVTGACVLRFSVRDTGIGIPADKHDKLFKPFSQVDDSTTRRFSGTGLGLAICRNLVRLMGGEIDFTSEPGRGSTFSFTICAPVATPPLAPRTLHGLRLGIAARPGPLRAELAELARGWSTPFVEADSPSELEGKLWDIALVDVNETVARALAERPDPLPGLPPQRAFGLVPVSFPTELRQALRVHFRVLINKPVHHDSLLALLSGSSPHAMAAAFPPTHFGFHVLVVEDNLANQRLMRRVLTNFGCTTEVMDNGRRALDELSERAASYDLVLLDLHMPEMDGLTALHAIRSGKAGPRAQGIWVVALTADVRAEQRTQALAAGLNDYLTKPLKIPELEAALRRFRVERVTVQAQT
ncbi:MAG: ATP-binding protein [Opitutaceae bacterium]